MSMSSKPILRFAPSPNGYLHLGHAYSALMTHGMAQALGGTMLLRIEDIDLNRSKPEFVAATFEDLRWLGLSWPEPVMFQSDRFAAYEQAFEKLVRMELVYPCFCSRAEVAEHAVGTDPDGAPRYGGTCRSIPRGVALGRIAAGERAAWRLDMNKALATNNSPLECHEHEPFLNVEAGSGGAETSAKINAYERALTTRTLHPEDWGDAVIVRKDTPTSYHLSVVVDDAAQGVTHVTRGRDLYRATDLQVLLQKLLDLPTPIYAHHGLILDEGDKKLSKSKGAPSLRSLREAGVTAAEVRRRVEL
jgi:glutamyl-Q tRNA(Asp) synthetase